MPRTRPSIGLAPLILSLGTPPAEDDGLTPRILDAAEDLLGTYGLRRWSVDDVADRAGVGRTTVYRTFANRDDIVHAVLARELRRTLARIEAAANAAPTLEDQLLDASVTALACLRESVVDKLLHSDPDTFLPFLTTGAEPLIALARRAIAARALAIDPTLDPQQAAELGEVAARLGLSLILTRGTIFPVDDEAAMRISIARVLEPVLGR